MTARLRTAFLAGLVLSLLLVGCSTLPQPSYGATTFVIVRHAEKATEGGSDPSLSPAGQARAQKLAERLPPGTTLRAVYATGYRRTQDTARPAAQAHGLQVITYDAGTTAADFAARLRREHAASLETVLVVGHSNTAPELAAALCQCEVAPMGETEFDRLMTVTVLKDGAGLYHEERY